MQHSGTIIETVFLLAAVGCLASDVAADISEVKPGAGVVCQSPDGNLLVFVDVARGPTFCVKMRLPDNEWHDIVTPSALGLVIDDIPSEATPHQPRSLTFRSTGSRDVESTNWKPAFGKTSSPGQPYRACNLIFPAKGRCLLEAEFRVFDDGIAVRYILHKSPSADKNETCNLNVTRDLTEFRFAEDSQTWSYNGEHNPKGPTRLSDLKGRVRMPVAIEAPDDLYMAVLEAALFDWDIVELSPIAECSTGLSVTMKPCRISLTGAGGYQSEGFSTPWHVLQISNSAGGLLESNILENLNPPCKIEDTSWIEPGLAMWDWRAWGAETDDGFTYGLDMPSWRRFIDFASKFHVRYLVLDAGWYGLEFDKRSDPRTCRDYLLVQPEPQDPRLVPRPAPDPWDDPIDIPELIQYGKSKNVGVILYFNDIARNNFPFEETLALYQQWGAAGIKYGFMKGSGQQKVRETRKIIELCAKHQLLCDFHDDPVPPTGDCRTYPNCITREFCHSQSDARRAFSPTGFCQQVFVNMLAGPLDMCNGLYTLKNPAQDRPKIFTNVNTTIAAETARVMISYSGLSILPDCPEAYEARSDLFEFLGKLPMTWDETRVLHGRIGHFITMARRRGNHWFIASATNEESRTLPISLDFLVPGQVYAATLYEDDPGAHYMENREAYRVRRIRVKQGDTMNIWLAPGGGHSVFLEPQCPE